MDQDSNNRPEPPPDVAQSIRDRYYPMAGNWIMASWFGVYVQLRLRRLQDAFSLSDAAEHLLDQVSFTLVAVTVIVGLAVAQYGRFKLYGWGFLTTYLPADARFHFPTAGWFVLALILLLEGLMLAGTGH